jgi:hypothetical protein
MNMIKLTCSDNINSRLTGDIGKKPNTLELLHYNDSKSCLVSSGFTAVANT